MKRNLLIFLLVLMTSSTALAQYPYISHSTPYGVSNNIEEHFQTWDPSKAIPVIDDGVYSYGQVWQDPPNDHLFELGDDTDLPSFNRVLLSDGDTVTLGVTKGEAALAIKTSVGGDNVWIPVIEVVAGGTYEGSYMHSGGVQAYFVIYNFSEPKDVNGNYPRPSGAWEAGTVNCRLCEGDSTERVCYCEENLVNLNNLQEEDLWDDTIFYVSVSD